MLFTGDAQLYKHRVFMQKNIFILTYHSYILKAKNSLL